MRSVLQKASQEKKAVGAFNVANMEMIRGVIKAAEELNTPVIMQVTEAWETHAPLELMAPAMISAAHNAAVDVVVHLDHGRDISTILKALELGFSSVMLDASHLPFEENIELVRRIVKRANNYDASVEGELGVIGGNEEGGKDFEALCTKPSEVQKFCERTNVDALAIAIGTAHGYYKVKPNLRFDVLEECGKITNTPLVLHGGSGLTSADFQKVISLGIRKINIATASFDSMLEEIRDMDVKHGKDGYFEVNEKMVNGTYESVKKHIRIFNMEEDI
jgi:fructose-bisphosphate aldolase class II